MEEIIKSIATRIGVFKSAHGFNHSDVAILLNMQERTLTNKLSGASEWNAAELLKLCEVLDCSPNELLNWNTEEK